MLYYSIVFGIGLKTERNINKHLVDSIRPVENTITDMYTVIPLVVVY